MPEQEIVMINEALSAIKTGVARIETKLDSHTTAIKDHESRLRELEGKSGKKYDAVVTAIVSAVLVGIVGFILGKLL